MLRVASYNIRKAVGLDWRRDAARIVDVLGEIDADIVVLQEADKRLGARPGVLPETLLDELGYRFIDYDKDTPSHGWHGNAMIYRPDRFDLSASRKIDLPALEPRGSISATFGPASFEVLGVHLGLTPGTREKQIRHLARFVEAADHPVLIAGDFNSTLPNPKIAEKFSKSVHVLTPGPTFHAANPFASLDRFVLSGFGTPAQSHVHRSKLARRASDHLPIVLEVPVTKAAQTHIGKDEEVE
ncbi:MAG: endonuclease/exonuclease/phosphatase family protein [Pseudomonadota bacterium]